MAGNKQKLKKGKAGAGGSNKKAGSAKEDCPLATLTVAIEREGDKKDKNFNSRISVKGPSKKSGKQKSETSKDYAKLKPGDYEVSAKPPAGKGYYFETPVKQSLGAGDKKKVTLKLKRAELVKVTPDTDRKQYINLKKKKAKPDQGRVIDVEAFLDKEMRGVRVYFALKDEPKNKADLHKNYKAKITKSDKTDKKGKAKAKLTVSQNGGEKFTVVASLFNKPLDPGANTKESGTFEVWRKIWYQKTYAAGLNPPDPAASVAAWKEVKVEMLPGDPKNKVINKADLPASLQSRTFYPNWMLVPGGGAGESAIVGDHNESKFFKAFKKEADKPVKAHLVICRHNWYPAAKATAWDTKTLTAGSRTVKFTWPRPAGAKVIKPAITGKVVAGGSKYRIKQGGKTKKYKISDADISIPNPRGNMREVVFTLPAGKPTPSAAIQIKVSLRVRYAESYLGMNDKYKVLAVFDPGDVVDYNDTVTHEIGHGLNQTPGPKNKGDPKGLPPHPHYYWDINGGQGPHCHTANGGGPGVLVNQVAPFKRVRWGKKQQIKKRYLTGVCVMFDSGPQANAIHKFCDTCKPYVLLQDMRKFRSPEF